MTYMLDANIFRKILFCYGKIGSFFALLWGEWFLYVVKLHKRGV